MFPASLGNIFILEKRPISVAENNDSRCSQAEKLSSHRLEKVALSYTSGEGTAEGRDVWTLSFKLEGVRVDTRVVHPDNSKVENR